MKKISEMFADSKIIHTFAPQLRDNGCKANKITYWRDGRVVDYSGLENRRTERYRGFESLSLR